MEENQSTDGNGRDLRNQLEGGAFTPVSPEDNLEIVPPETVEILQSIGLDRTVPLSRCTPQHHPNALDHGPQELLILAIKPPEPSVSGPGQQVPPGK